jgi:hypothetical protein
MTYKQRYRFHVTEMVMAKQKADESQTEAKEKSADTTQ